MRAWVSASKRASTLPVVSPATPRFMIQSTSPPPWPWSIPKGATSLINCCTQPPRVAQYLSAILPPKTRTFTSAPPHATASCSMNRLQERGPQYHLAGEDEGEGEGVAGVGIV